MQPIASTIMSGYSSYNHSRGNVPSDHSTQVQGYLCILGTSSVVLIFTVGFIQIAVTRVAHRFAIATSMACLLGEESPARHGTLC